MDHHFVKLEEASEEKDDILVPKPSKNHSFCGLCRLHFEDYLTHLELEVHRDNLKKAKFQKSISTLFKILVKKDKRVERQAKRQLKEVLKTKKVQKERKHRTAVKVVVMNIEETDSSSMNVV